MMGWVDGWMVVYLITKMLGCWRETLPWHFPCKDVNRLWLGYCLIFIPCDEDMMMLFCTRPVMMMIIINPSLLYSAEYETDGCDDVVTAQSLACCNIIPGPTLETHRSIRFEKGKE